MSRETRLLLVTAAISLCALWALARLRFPEQPASTSPLPPLLSQLSPRMALDDLAAEVARLQPRLLPSLALVARSDLGLPTDQTRRGETAVPALRFGSDVAVAFVGTTVVTPGSQPLPGSVIGSDPATGLAVVRVPVQDPQPLSFWSPESVRDSRFLIASDVSGNGLSFRPVFAGTLNAIDSPVFSSTIWLGLVQADIAPGSFVFTTDGALAGLVVTHENSPAIVPAETVMAIADRLLSEEHRDTGRLGIAVQALTPVLAKAMAASTGVVVTWVDPEGPGAEKIAVLDVIEALNGEPIATAQHWQARAMRLAAGEAVTVRVRRRGADTPGAAGLGSLDVRLVASASPAGGSATLGLTLRAARDGAEVIGIVRGSSAGRAGIQVGDVITVAGRLEKPGPGQVRAAFAAAAAQSSVPVAITRGDAHFVVALEKP